MTGRSGRSALSRSFRHPFDPVGDGTSLRNSRHHPFPVPGTQSVFDTPPCLIARDQRNGARAATMMMTGLDLHQIATMETGTAASARTTGRGGTPFFGAFPSEDGYLSWEARRRRQAYAYAMCALCILPFFAPLVYRGTFDAALSWYTRGETGSLTRRQRRNVLVTGIVFSGVWLVVLAVFVTVVVNRKAGGVHS